MIGIGWTGWIAVGLLQVPAAPPSNPKSAEAATSKETVTNADPAKGTESASTGFTLPSSDSTDDEKSGKVLEPSASTSKSSDTPVVGLGARPADIERDLLVEQLLSEIARERGVKGIALPSIDIAEREVEALRQTADGLAGAGSETEHLLLGAGERTNDLEMLGVSDAKADEIRNATDDVQALRAELALQKLRGTSSSSPGEKLIDVTQVPDVEPVDPSESTPGPDGVRTVKGLEQALRFPNRTITLLYRMGDYARLFDVVERVGKDKLGPDSKYAYGAALAAGEKWDEARAVFETLLEIEGRRMIAHAATRQVERIDLLMVGAVDLPPLEKARSER